jgi:N-acylneuraminate cytidylyltransferase
MKIIALLPMKGHSERVPNKNLRMFNGVPLFHIILKKLDKVELINEIIINTDSNIISDSAISVSKKVKIHKRIPELCGDMIPMNEIINYDINNSDGDFYIQTHSTNPLLKVETINNALQFFQNNIHDYDSVYSVTRHQARFYFENMKAVNHNPNELLRTQDLPPLFEENSCFYIFSNESFKSNSNKRIGKKPHIFEMNRLESVDIDENEDFILAELIHKNFPEYQ